MLYSYKCSSCGKTSSLERKMADYIKDWTCSCSHVNVGKHTKLLDAVPITGNKMKGKYNSLDTD